MAAQFSRRTLALNLQGPLKLFEHLVRFDRRLHAHPSDDHRDHGDGDFPPEIQARVPSDHRQGQWADAAERNNDRPRPKIPRQLDFRDRWRDDSINELTAVLAYDRIVLDLLGAVVALFHGGEGVPSSTENLRSFAREATTDFRKSDPR
jgi:hypothetical protein